MSDNQTARRTAVSGRLSWREAYRRLEALRDLVEQDFTTTVEDKHHLLVERARALTLVPVAPESTTKGLEVVEFLLSDELYAMESAYVYEVRPLREYTPVPCTPPFVFGIINVRGQIVSVIDLKHFLGLRPQALTERTRVLVVCTEVMEVGILVDAVLGVCAIPPTEMRPPLTTLAGRRAEYLKGMTTKPLMVLDAPKLLADRKLVVHEQVDM